MHLRKILALSALATLLVSGCASAYTVVMADGQRVDVGGFRVVGDTVEGRKPDGNPWVSDMGKVDFEQTFLQNLSSSEEQGIYLARGKVLTFSKIEVVNGQVRLVLSDKGEITLPVGAVDFRTTVIEGRGLSVPALQRSPAPTSASVAGPAVRGRSARIARRPPAYTRPAPTVPSRPPEEPEPEASGDGGGFAALAQARTPGDRAERAVPLEPPEPAGEQAVDDDTDTASDTMDEAFGNGGGGGGDEPPGSVVPPRRIKRAEVVQKVDPVYDTQLVPEGRGLTALMEVTVGTSGTVTNVKVIKSTGNPTLDAAGIDAIQQYIYTPAEKDGVPFESRRLERVSFRRE